MAPSYQTITRLPLPTRFEFTSPIKIDFFEKIPQVGI